MQTSGPETKEFNSSLPFSDFRVLTFNIRYGTADDRENAWTLRRDFVADVIRNSNSDLIGLQEALDFQIDELLRLLPEFSSVGVGREDGVRKGEFAPIFYRTDRFKVERQGNFWLSAAPDTPNSITWGNACTRICTYARLHDKTAPDAPAILMFNTHLDHVSELSRELGIRLVIQKMKTIALPTDTVFLTGDFNVDDEDPVISFLTGMKANSSEQDQKPRSTQPDVCIMGGYGSYTCGSVQKIVGMLDRQARDRYIFRDTYRELHPLPSREDIAQGKLEEATYHAFTGKVVGRRIDFCFMLNPNAEVLSAEILREVRNSRYPSDHYPVITVVRIPHPER